MDEEEEGETPTPGQFNGLQGYGIQKKNVKQTGGFFACCGPRGGNDLEVDSDDSNKSSEGSIDENAAKNQEQNKNGIGGKFARECFSEEQEELMK